MNAKALICAEDQSFSLETVTLPEPGPGQVLVRTLYSGVSIGTEFALVRNKISWGPYPLCTGYMGTGIVEKTGEDVTDYSEGDAVYFRANASIRLSDGTTVSPVSGTHCSHIVTTTGGTHGIGKLPEGASPETASLFVMPAVGLNGVDMAGPGVGDTVVVHGTGLIGLGVVAACAQRGCRVMAVDIKNRHLELAGRLGAEHLVNSADCDLPAEVEKLFPGGAGFVFECTGIPKCIDPAITLCREHGSFVWQGNYGAEPVSMQFLVPHGKRLKMYFPCDDGLSPCRHAVVRNMAMGVLPWEHTVTHRVGFTDAPELFRDINAGNGGDIIGAVINWRE